MTWEDYLVETSELEGRQVWIVDIRTSDGNAYIRNVGPTLVRIMSNEELPEGKRIYYSKYHFRKIGKSGKLLKQILAPYDNTGYRSNPGTSVNVFETYEEAVAKYNEQLNDVIEVYEERKRELEAVIERTESMKIKLYREL